MDPQNLKNALVASVVWKWCLGGWGGDVWQLIWGCCHAWQLLRKGGIDGGGTDAYGWVLCFGCWTRDIILVGGRWGHVLQCSHTKHVLVYACRTHEQGHRVCRRDGETIGGVCVGQKQSRRREKMVSCLLCVCVLSPRSILFFRTFSTLVYDVVWVKRKVSCVQKSWGTSYEWFNCVFLAVCLF